MPTATFMACGKRKFDLLCKAGPAKSRARFYVLAHTCLSILYIEKGAPVQRTAIFWGGAVPLTAPGGKRGGMQRFFFHFVCGCAILNMIL